MSVTGPRDSARGDTLAGERRRVRRLFNRAAGVLAVFDAHLRREYARTLDRVALGTGLDVLDLGTGTGNLAAALHGRGHRVVGIDFSERSLARARRSCPGVRLVLGDLFELGAVRSNIFDLVTVAYVLHGLPPPLRAAVLDHARRISRGPVLLLDYARRGPWYVRFIEFLEGPHYPSFAARPVAELLREAGLEIAEHGVTSKTGGYWLAGPIDAGHATLAHTR
ncbi:MAG: class I SAM-dependent methyltransferase [Acidobacteriota bacterium]